MRFLTLLTGLLVCYLFYGFYIAQYDPRFTLPAIEVPHPPGFYDYRGVIHVHSERSIGSGSLQEIIQEARDTGLDFIHITDVNPFDQSDWAEGYYSDLLVFLTGKYSYLDARLLYFDLNKQNPPSSLGDAQIRFNDYLSQRRSDLRESFLVLVHPLRPGFRWSGNYPPGLDGIEIINLKSILYDRWEENKATVLWSVLMLPFNMPLAFLRLYQDPREEQNLWDQLLRQNNILGFTGADATAKAIPFGRAFIRFPSYSRSFEIASNHVLLDSELTGNAQTDRTKIHRALRQGRFYMAIDALGDPKGFLPLVKASDGEVYQMGDEISFREGLRLALHFPDINNQGLETWIYRDGQRVHVLRQDRREWEIKEPGIYRLVVRLRPNLPFPDHDRWIPWLYTNPFYIR